MPILGERFSQMSNAIFCYDLKPIPLAVYSYLVCCAGQKDLCWPSIKTIALHCSCSENAARDAVKQLVERNQAGAPRRKLAAEQQPLLHPTAAGAFRRRPSHKQGLRHRRWWGNVSTKRRIIRKKSCRQIVIPQRREPNMNRSSHSVCPL